MEEQEAPPSAAPMPAQRGKALWIAVAVVIVVAVVVVAAVFLGVFNAPPAEDGVLKIGIVMSLTGQSGLEVFGPKNYKGAQLAIEEINKGGGVLGKPIQYVLEDDQGIDSVAADKARKLITTDHVDAIIGAVGSGKCAAALEVTRPNGVVQVSASCTSPVFSNTSYSGGWFFRTAPSDALQGVVAATYSKNNLSWTSMAAIGNNNPYGRGLANVFKTKFIALGGTVTNLGIFPEGKTSYTSDLQTLFTGTLPQAVYMANYPTDGLNIMRDWYANANWRSVKWLFSEGVLDQAGFVDKLTAMMPLTVVQTFNGSAPGAYLGVVGGLYDRFFDNYTARFAGEDPGLFTANAYDAVYLIAAAAQRAQATVGSAIKGQMRTVSGPPGTTMTGGQWKTILPQLNSTADVNYEGASGAVNLDQFGDPLSGYGIWGVDETGKIKTLALFDEAAVVAMQGSPPETVSASSLGIASVEWIAPTRLN
jgi:branched-chain amino acid transport system substrate-binding protein